MMKKTISVKYGEVCWRLVSYSLVDGFVGSRLPRSSQSPEFCGVLPRKGLCERLQCWEAPPKPGAVVRLWQRSPPRQTTGSR